MLFFSSGSFLYYTVTSREFVCQIPLFIENFPLKPALFFRFYHSGRLSASHQQIFKYNKFNVQIRSPLSHPCLKEGGPSQTVGGFLLDKITLSENFSVKSSICRLPLGEGALNKIRDDLTIISAVFFCKFFPARSSCINLLPPCEQ